MPGIEALRTYLTGYKNTRECLSDGLQKYPLPKCTSLLRIPIYPYIVLISPLWKGGLFEGVIAIPHYPNKLAWTLLWFNPGMINCLQPLDSLQFLKMSGSVREPFLQLRPMQRHFCSKRLIFQGCRNLQVGSRVMTACSFSQIMAWFFRVPEKGPRT